MKKLISSVLVIILSLLVLSSCGDTNAPDGMILASGEAASYTLLVPEDWKVDLSTGITSAHAEEGAPVSVSVTSYDLENTDSTVDEWWEINKTDLAVAFTDFKEITVGADTVLGGVNAKEYVYSAKLGGAEYVYHQVACVRGDGIVYIVTYTATPDTYESNLETFNKITSNFSF